jgi:hypothetical protein
MSRGRESRIARAVVRSAVAVLLIGTAAESQVGSPAPSAAPPGRNKPAFAYDPVRRQLVLFGGFGASRTGPSVLDDGWEWPNERWRPLERTAFPARAAAGVAADTRRERVVLFGGEDPAGVCGDTLEWDGKAWRRVAWSGPPARTVAQLAYDSKRGRAVLFGGSDAGRHPLGDTWEWDGTLWKKVAVSGPPPRTQHVLAYHAGRGRVVLFGGNATGRYDKDSPTGQLLGDTWEWDGSQWSLASRTGPPARDHHAMAYDEARGKVVLFGGWNGKFLDDVWEWDGAWTQVAATGPSARGGLPSMAYHPLLQMVVLYGGWGDRGPETDAWRWNGRAWTRIE